MGKKLFKLLVVLAVLTVAGRWLLEWDIRSQVDDMLAGVSEQVSISYGRLHLGFDGVITVNRIQVNSVEEEQYSAFIQKIAVDMDSLPALIQRRFSGDLPASLLVKIEGVNANINHAAAVAEVDVDCLNPERQPAPWMLGIDSDSDIILHYQYNPSARDLIVDLDMLVRGGYELDTQLRFGEVSPNLARVGSLDLLRFNFDDIRSVQAWTDYCTKRHQLDAEQLRAAHIAGVEKYLAYRGLALTEPARAAYAQYLQNPSRLTLRWLLNIPLDQPEAMQELPTRLRDKLEVEFAGSPISPIFVEREPLRDEPKVVQPVEPEKPKGPVEISFDETRNYVGKTIHVVTGNKTTTGKVLKVGESELVVEVVKDGTNRFSITFYRSRLDKILVDAE